ncbi:alpha/beta hydrolase fold-domain-containing protein [Xylariaceae sp. FL1651]|nr:alpha/beta hydrolase fold-domain-containing protein [Xylariaceae sp. FL1651]
MASTNAEKDQFGQLRKARLGLIWALLPKIPLLARVIFSHILGISETARYLDLETDVTLTVLRSMLDNPKPRPIAKTQAMTLMDPGVKGRIWISNVASKVPPETGIRDALLAVIHAMSDSGAREAGFRIPDIVPVEAEWTGYRAAAKPDSRLPAVSEAQRYAEMMKECKNATTVLYFHGGAYYLCDPATHRPLAKRLAKLTGGRVYSVRYRLAPQHPFPAALLDALVSYFTLLYPPPGSVHEAVSPEDIIIGGDSAGGNLTLALVQTLLELRRQGRKVAWFGEERDAPLPAGVAVNSPWLDLAQSMPSWAANQKWDYLPPPDRPQPPADHVWPATPPRRHLYADDALLLHPLVSVHLVGGGSWAGAPPVWLCCGWECLADEDRYLAARLAADGVPVVFEEYEAMPHVFAAVLPRLAATERCMRGWARFINNATNATNAAAAAAAADGAGKEKEKETGVRSSYTYIKAKTLEESELDVRTLTPYEEKDVFELAYAKVGRKAPLPLVSSKL